MDLSDWLDLGDVLTPGEKRALFAALLVADRMTGHIRLSALAGEMGLTTTSRPLVLLRRLAGRGLVKKVPVERAAHHRGNRQLHRYVLNCSFTLYRSGSKN